MGPKNNFLRRANANNVLRLVKRREKWKKKRGNKKNESKEKMCCPC